LGFLKRYFSKDKEFYQSLKNLLGFYPNNIIFYQKAFRHRSVAAADHDSNERLEYLGDAVFGAIIAHYLFQKFPFKDEGFLTQMRSKLVNRSHLNNLARKMGLDKMIQYYNDSNSGFKSIHGDAFEALIGAIYLDKGFEFTQKFVINNVIKLHIDINHFENTEFDYKSKLLNWAQKEKKQLRFEAIEEALKNNDRQFTVTLFIDEKEVSKGIDFSKKKAEQQAAEKAFNLFVQ
jgi:ribonuclease III